MEHAFFYEKGRITVTGILGVDGFDEKQARIKLETGILTVYGENFVLLDMAQSAGKVAFSGKLTGLSYGEKPVKGSFFQKIFR